MLTRLRVILGASWGVLGARDDWDVEGVQGGCRGVQGGCRGAVGARGYPKMATRSEDDKKRGGA